MTVPGWLYWITYIAVPALAGILGLAGWRPARGVKTLGVALLLSAAINIFELVRMADEMNSLGAVVYGAILISQLGLGGCFARDRGGRVPRAVLGALALATVGAMLAVRAQVLWLFG